MSMYKLPDFKNNRLFWLAGILFVLLGFYGFSSGYITFEGLKRLAVQEPQKSEVPPADSGPYKSDISYEQAIIDSVKTASPSVVSIVISKKMPVYEQEWIDPFGEGSPFGFQIPQYVQKGTKKQEVGAGSGFIVSSDGLILTNKHVVSDKSAEYTIIASDGKKYSGKVMALDPVQDLAVVKISAQDESASGGQVNFPAIKLGDSFGIQIGQGVIAIGNALGQFSNTVSVGIVSGLGRTISASDQLGALSETLENIIQTDAAINSGNSGGPLINLKGEVIGINTAMAQGAENIGFSIPINIAKKDLAQVIKDNKITYPFLGVGYVSADNGVLVKSVTKGSAAEKAGLKVNDIVLEFNGEKITASNKMSQIITKYNPGDKIALKVQRDKKEITLDTVLGER